MMVIFLFLIGVSFNPSLYSELFCVDIFFTIIFPPLFKAFFSNFAHVVLAVLFDYSLTTSSSEFSSGITDFLFCAHSEYGIANACY